MYSDIYSRLTPEERKLLESYHIKLAKSQEKLHPTEFSSPEPTPKSYSKPKPNQISLPAHHPPKPNTSISKTPNSQKHFSKIIKTTPRNSTISSPQASKSHQKPNTNLNLQTEIEKVLQVLHQHSQVCTSFKDLLKSSNISLLDDYLNYKKIAK